MTTTEGWSGRTALVTGGRQGIGRAFARELVRRGCRVVVTSRTPEGKEMATCLTELEGMAAEGTPAPVAIAWDMEAHGSDETVARVLNDASLKIEILVHAAHVFSPHELILANKPSTLARSLEHNVVAPYALARRLCRSMARARFGRVLFVGSLAASLGGVGQVNYIAEKSALEGLARAFASEFGRRGVLVNVIAPGLVDTENVRKKVRPEVATAFARQTLPDRLATPEEVVLASMSLLDPRQGFVTGQVLRIAGGIDGLARLETTHPGNAVE